MSFAYMKSTFILPKLKASTINYSNPLILSTPTAPIYDISQLKEYIQEFEANEADTSAKIKVRHQLVQYIKTLNQEKNEFAPLTSATSKSTST